MLPQRSDVGIALSREDEGPLLEAMRASQSPSLYPFFILSLDAGLRPSETRSLRRSNLHLNWREGKIEAGEIIVGASKTEAGAGRIRSDNAPGVRGARGVAIEISRCDLGQLRVSVSSGCDRRQRAQALRVRLDQPMSETSSRTHSKPHGTESESNFAFTVRVIPS